MREYEVRPGMQYDRNGATVFCDTLVTRYSGQGELDGGHPLHTEDYGPVADAVKLTIIDRQIRMLRLGEPAAKDEDTPNPFADCTFWTNDQGCPLHGELCR